MSDVILDLDTHAAQAFRKGLMVDPAPLGRRNLQIGVSKATDKFPSGRCQTTKAHLLPRDNDSA
ncbi:hypothetical protein [Sphingomonas pituitosa]|uniref:hypothetical protein n=1 Tax=Sphingomonas pituitosa TaxID=99597 RepID=UPI000AB91F06|nr:hypothetical protein [Sphingomonas pituitosa]